MTPPEKRKGTGVIELLAKLQSGAVNPGDISLEERRSCVNYLRLEGYTQEEMAKIFGVHRATIGRDEKILCDRAARMVAEIKTDAVAAGLVSWAKHLTAKAMKEKNHALVWRIQKELTDKLQSLGIIVPETRPQVPETFVAHFGRANLDPPMLPAPEDDGVDAEYGDQEG